MDLTATEEVIKANLAKFLLADAIALTHFNEEGMYRRQPIWKSNNIVDEKLKNRILIDFWKEWRFDIVQMNIETNTEEEIVQKVIESSDKENAEYDPVVFCHKLF